MGASLPVRYLWIVYQSPASQQRINEQTLSHPPLVALEPKTMPFNGKPDALRWIRDTAEPQAYNAVTKQDCYHHSLMLSI